MQLWIAGYNYHLTVECRAGKATINLQLTLKDKPPPPQRAHKAAANTADAPEADASEATDKSDSRTAL